MGRGSMRKGRWNKRRKEEGAEEKSKREGARGKKKHNLTPNECQPSLPALNRHPTPSGKFIFLQ